MAPNQEVSALKRSAVPFRERLCPEHTFNVKENLKVNKAKNCPNIWMIFHALLNSIGGILIIKSTQAMESLEMDEWLQSCNDYLQYLPPLILTSIGYSIYSSTITMFVPRYPRKLPHNLCLIVRHFTGNQKIQDLDLLQTIMKRKSESPSYLNLAHQYNYEDEFPYGENQNREYKGWTTKSYSELVDHVACTNTNQKKMYEQSVKFQKTLLAMANETRGGEVILGIREDKTDNKLKVKGIPLEDSDRPEFEEVIENLLKEDPCNRETRVWCEPGTFPEKGTHWRVTYHEVTQPGHMKRVLIRIQIDHYPGGVFEVEPNIFDVNSDGFIIKMPFMEWKESFLNTEKPSTSVVETETVEPMASTEGTGADDEDGATGGDADDEDGATGGDADVDGVEAVEGTFSQESNNALMIDTILQNRPGLSWTADNDNWNQNLGDIREHVEEHISGDSACFDLQSPLNFTPRKETLISRHEDNLKEKIEFIENYHDTNKGFVIRGEPGLYILSDSFQAPSNHILDLLVLVYTGLMHELHLWTVMADSSNQPDLWEYVIQCGLLFKQRLMDHHRFNISVICHSLSLSDEHHTTSGHEEEVKRHLCSESENTLDNIKKSLARILFKKHTHLATYVGGDALIQLSEKQAKGYSTLVTSTVAFVKGPAGSGKTVLALCIAEHFKDVVFICTNKAFEQYIKFQCSKKSSIRCNTHFAKSEDDLKKILTSEEVQHAKCLISDDMHNLDCSKEGWREAVLHLIKQKIRIYLFADPFIQEHEESNTTKALKEALQEIEEEYGVPISVISLTENHRNSRKVTSFIMRMVEGTPGEGYITSFHNLDGDDIEVWKGENLYASGKENGLLILFRKVFAGEKGFSYEPHQMALLLIGKYATEYKPLITKVLAENLEPKVHVQGADEFPRTGVQVDVAEEFSGLEASMAIVLHPQKNEDDRISEELWMNDPRLLAFLASRGVLRVIFVVEKLNFEVFEKMKLDNKLLKIDIPDYTATTFKESYGKEGSGEGSFSYPWGIATSPVTGNLAVSDRNNHRIHILTADLTPVRVFGTRGSGPGQFQFPASVCFSSSGTLFIADCYNHRIKQVTEDEGPIRIFGSQGSGAGEFRYPRGICWEEGLLYICDSENRRIQVMRESGEHVLSIGSQGPAPGKFTDPPYFIAACAQHDKLVVTDDTGNLHLFFLDGRHRKTIRAGQPPYNIKAGGVMIDELGQVIVSDNKEGCLVVLGEDKVITTIRLPAGEGMADPRGVTMTSDGSIIVCDFDKCQIHKFTVPKHK